MDTNTRLRFFSSDDQRWATPQPLFDRFDKVFKFKLDPCCSHKTAKCDMHFTILENGLKQPWHRIGNTYINPPFGRELYQWVEKSYFESREGIISAMLIPARPDTRAWHDFCLKHGTILFIKSRIKFEDQRDVEQKSTSNAFFPSSLVVFGDIESYPYHDLDDLGVWVRKL